MSERKCSILEDWPSLKEEMTEFLPNPYKWLESKLEHLTVPLKSAEDLPPYYRRQEREKNMRNLLDILKTVNTIYSPISFDISLSMSGKRRKREATP